MAKDERLSDLDFLIACERQDEDGDGDEDKNFLVPILISIVFDGSNLDYDDDYLYLNHNLGAQFLATDYN